MLKPRNTLSLLLGALCLSVVLIVIITERAHTVMWEGLMGNHRGQQDTAGEKTRGGDQLPPNAELFSNISNSLNFVKSKLMASTEDSERPDRRTEQTKQPLVSELKFLTADFYASDHAGGVSNQLFEFISIIGIARLFGRVPYITVGRGQAFDKLSQIRSIFPNLSRYFVLRFPEDSQVRVSMGHLKCCVHANFTELERQTDTTDVLLEGRYFQVYKYFDRFRDEIRSSILHISEDVRTIAHTKLIDSRVLSSSKHRICLHIRRGDFVTSKLHMETRTDFIVWAVHHIIESDKLQGNVSVLMFGIDHNWAVDVSNTFFNGYSYVTNVLDKTTPIVDYAFAQSFCDTTLISAASSSFSFWTSYLSLSAKKTYYNTNFSTPGGVETEFKPADFYPPHWIPLTMPADYNLQKPLIQITPPPKSNVTS